MVVPETSLHQRFKENDKYNKNKNYIYEEKKQRKS